MKPIVSDTGKNQSGLFVIFVVVDSKLMLGKHWIHEMWVLSKQVLTVRHNVSHLIVQYLLLVENKGSLILMFTLSFDIAEIYK